MLCYITKHALTQGIITSTVPEDKWNDNSSGLVLLHGYYLKKKDIFLDKEEAERNVEERRLSKIKSLQKQIKKLETFEVKYCKEN